MNLCDVSIIDFTDRGLEKENLASLSASISLHSNHVQSHSTATGVQEHEPCVSSGIKAWLLTLENGKEVKEYDNATHGRDLDCYWLLRYIRCVNK